ncbi:kinetochore-associated protein DSN1 homolog isoform X2 [Grus americana]|uniref:kinetochore-associated protein DSN1 homolog isoform X2 n=1 Tax=Grus americana TaxID=9117 RepID=UPI002407AB9F|nr:kinetochore-associated protein DSN1 homolog isoform X2 [Grus americana]
MAEPSLRGCGAAGSSGPLSVLQRPSGGSEERSPRGARTAVEGGVAESDPGEKKADPEQFLKLDVTAVSKNVSPHEATGAAMRKRSHESPSLRKSPLGPSPKRLSPWRSSPRKDHASSSFNLSPRQLIATPQAKRRSWCRSSLKGTKRRKSLPPVHQDVTELSKSISLDLPEIDRLSLLLLSSFQFSARKLEHVLKETDGFSPEAFRANVQSVSEDLKRYVQKLKRDGTLKSCVEDPKGTSLDSALDESVAQVKEYIARFAAEGQAWDQLVLRYQERAEETSRRLEECRRSRGRAEPLSSLQTSQAGVLGTKPDYQKILEEQGEVLRCMELVLDELQQAAKVLQAFGEDSRQYLRRLSEQLAARTFRHLENSPVRKLIAAPPRKTPAPDG